MRILNILLILFYIFELIIINENFEYLTVSIPLNLFEVVKFYLYMISIYFILKEKRKHMINYSLCCIYYYKDLFIDRIVIRIKKKSF